MNKVSIIISLILAMAAVLGSCVTIKPAAETPATAPSALPSSPVPEYKTLAFTLEGNVANSFPVYLRNEQTLHLLVETDPMKHYAERGRVWIHILTPSGKRLGSYGVEPSNPGQYANGTLSEGFAQSFSSFCTQFSPSDYEWGEGYYRVECQSEYTKTTEVKVEYWIED